MGAYDTETTELRERGFTVLERAVSPDDVAFLRERIARGYASLGSPPTFARPPVWPQPEIEISVVGLVFHQLGKHFPELASRIVHPTAVAILREALGDDMHLEYTSAVVCHGERPFFPWHAHVGGVDNVVYRKQGLFPTFERLERVATLLYLDDLDDAAGALLVSPRRVTDATQPPHDPTRERWDGEVELRCAAGTLVLMDQATWHAARAKSSPGLRAFVACFFTSSGAAKTSWVDESFRPFAADVPLLASVLHRP